MNTDNVWFTADTHAWHSNIIGYCDRPWTNAEDMTRALADNINAAVPANGKLYHLGDFAWGGPLRIEGFRSMINCKDITLVLGNHDKTIRHDSRLNRLFTKVCDIDEFNYGKRDKIVMCHYSMNVWNASFHGSWHLFGHSHGTCPGQGMSLDVGVDCWKYRPVSFEQISEKMKWSWTKKKEPNNVS